MIQVLGQQADRFVPASRDPPPRHLPSHPRQEAPAAARDLRTLYLHARRQALGVDAVLDSILDALPDDDELPF